MLFLTDNNNKRINQHIIAGLMIIASSLSFAGNTSTTQKATATLSSSCQFNTTDVVFGTYDPNASTPQQQSQAINILCSKGTTYLFYTNSPNDVNNNNQYAAMLSNSNNTLLYQVQLTNGTWENDLQHRLQYPGAIRGTGIGDWQPYSILYRIPANQYVPPDVYSATVTAFINF